MVAISVRMKTFCPIFFLPSLCFSTYQLQLPSAVAELHPLLGGALPVNLGPFLLLFATKIIIPHSSFVGHLSGIVIGYPLAWNMLNWLTPPMLTCILFGCYMYKEDLLVWKIAGYDHSSSAASDPSHFAPPAQLQVYQWLKGSTIALMLSSVATIYLLGPRQVPIRLLHAFLLWSSCQARRVEWALDGKLPLMPRLLPDVGRSLS